MQLVMGISFICTGSFGIYWVSKRSFERRNEFGVAGFKSYNRAIGTLLLEKAVKIVSIFCFFWISHAQPSMAWAYGVRF